MKKILVIIALLAALVVGAKFYLEYRYKQELDKAIQSASMFVDIGYDDLSVGFDGAVELLGLKVTPNETFETIKVRSIKLTGLDLLFHFNGQSQLEKGEFPGSLRFSVDQLAFSASLFEDELEGQECKSFYGTLSYSAAGYDEIITSGELLLDLTDPYAASVEFNGFDQISRSSYSINFNARQANAMAVATEGIPIQSMRYDLFLEEDAGEAIIKHCADKLKVTPEEFLEKTVKSKRFMANSFSMDLGQALRNSTAEFLQGGKEIVLRSTPSDRLKNLSFASTSSPIQIVKMLNLNVSMDGSTIPLKISRMNIDDEENDGYQRRDLEELLNSPDGTVQERVRPQLKKKRKKNNYEPATLSKINSYLDRDIRVSRTQDRSPIKGRLLGAEGQVLSVEIFRYGGVMTYTVPYSDISKLEVKKRRK